MSSIAYIPKSIQASCDQSVVSAIYGYAYDAVPIGGPSESRTIGPKTNHWVIYCILAEGTKSEHKCIRLEALPGGTSSTAGLLVSLKPNDMTNEASKSFRLRLKTDITFGQFMTLIISRGYHNYQFTAQGQGCRYWISCVTKLPKDDDYLTLPEEADAGVEILEQVWTVNGQLAPPEEQSGLAPGEFF
ncbi:MAG: hypothetical protein M1831_007477 [Alyxoria varia]|nr:MAG: hypothetical protein M1831_007477 [Alyxoria varia]